MNEFPTVKCRSEVKGVEWQMAGGPAQIATQIWSHINISTPPHTIGPLSSRVSILVLSFRAED